MEPDTPMNASWLMKLSIDNQDSSAFQSLFYEGAEENVSKSTFQKFGEITTAGTGYRNFELLTFENGEMLLVEFAPKTEAEDWYKIVNVIEVPDNMKTLFEE
ncbi:hypothetical protein ACLM5H_20320 [Fredinandcohnia humi]